MKLTAKQRRNAALRVAAGQSSEVEEAARLGVHRSTVSREVAKLAEESKSATTSATQQKATGATPAGKEEAKPEKTPLEVAREAAQGTPTKEASAAIAQAGLDDAKFCVETLQNYKSAGVYLVAQFSGVPSNDSTLQQLAPLSEMSKGAIAQNASWLAPLLRQQGSKETLYVILGIEAFLAYMMIRTLAQKYAPKEEKKDEQKSEAT